VVSDEHDDEGYQNLKCDILIKSIGYKSMQMPGVPFDFKRNVIPSHHGSVQDPETKEIIPGMYCCGWVKRGPVGIEDATMRDAMDTFRVIKHHVERDYLPAKETTRDEVV